MTTVEEIANLTEPHHPDDWTDVDSRAVDTVRVLAADAVQKVGNGHPGTAMSLAPLAYTLFQRQMRHDPTDTHWIGRDRFVLSCGHSSLTLYLQLYLGGFGLELSDIDALRTWGSKTPGHPEFHHTKGVEITTGPLGQGLASAVGMAMAARYERGLFDPDAAPGTSPFDHYIFVIASDGDIEEGVTSEAASLAGTLKLGRLIYLYDDNDISIEGNTDIAFREDVGARFRAYDWQVIGPIDGNDLDAVEAAIREAQGDTARPSLIICRTVIGFGSPAQGTGKVHGEPLGAEGVRQAKATLGWPTEPTFFVPDDVLGHMRRHIQLGRQAEQAWEDRMAAYTSDYPELAAQFRAEMRG